MPQNPPKIYTAAQMREREQAAVAAGTSFLQLMENAGQAAPSWCAAKAITAATRW